jgi:hypothetical protein
MAVISPTYLQNLLYAIDKSYESLKKAYGDKESPGSALYNLSLAKVLVRGGSDHELGLLPNYSHTASGNYVVSPTSVTRQDDGNNLNHFQISFPTISFVYKGVRGYVNSTTLKFNSKYGGDYDQENFAYVRGRDSYAKITTTGGESDRTTVFMVYIKDLQLNRDQVNKLYYYTGSLDYTTSHVVDKAGNHQSDPYVPPPPAPPSTDGPYIPLAYIKPSRYTEGGGDRTGIRLDLTRPYSLEQVHYAPQEETGILFNLLPALISAESSVLNQSSLNPYKEVFDSLSSHCNSRASISFREYVYNNGLVVSKSLRELYSLLYNRDFILNFCSGSRNGISTTGAVALAKGKIIIKFNEVSNSSALRGELGTYLIADKVKVIGKVTGTTDYILKLANYVNWPQSGTVGIRSSSSNGRYDYSLGAEGDTLYITSDSHPDVVPDEIYLLSEKTCVIPDNIAAGASVDLANEDYFGFWGFVSPQRASQIASNSSFVIRTV